MTQSGEPTPDDAFAAIVEAHDGLSPEASARLNARLVLLLAERVGDPAAVIRAATAARRGLEDA
ncbi:MAG: DUF2783 domain-containing protein [Rhodobacteraceae bacterium]|nr:MAG: DUF2783 domain-containing protein [Paracoccaceae bacterium]